MWCDRAFKGQPAAGAAAVVEHKHQEAQAAEVLGAHVGGHAPAVDHHLGMRPAVHADDDRIGAVSMLRTVDGAIQPDPSPGFAS